MRRTRKSYPLMLVTAVVALLLSTWGTGVALAQEHDMDHDDGVEHDMDHDQGDPGTGDPGTGDPGTGDPGTGGEEECSALAELFGLCTGAGGGEDTECSFLASLFGLCDTGTGTEEDCDSYSLLEWLFHHECHGHSFLS